MAILRADRETARVQGVMRRRIPLPDRGVEIALLDWGGEGPLALLHHANGFCAALWEPVALALRSRYRVVAMDARGHGDSSKPEGEDAYAWHHFGEDALALTHVLLDELSAERVGLGLGHSFGGTALLLAASLEPSRFEQLVTLDAVLHPPRALVERDPDRAARVNELADRARRRRQVFESRAAAREAWRDKPLFVNWQERAFELYLEEGLFDRPDGQVELKCPTAVEAAIFAAGPDFDVWMAAEKVTTRTLLLWAERGNFPRIMFEAVAQRMADATILDAPVGHFMLTEDPDLVIRETLRFVAGQNPEDADQRSTG